MDQKTFNEILAGAIKREIEAHEFYKQVSMKMKDAYLRDMFRGFAEEELKHQQILQGLLGKQDVAFHFARVPDFHVSETVGEKDAVLSIRMKPADAIALAMKKEEAAVRHYNQMADACSDPVQQKTFLELAVMERGHKNKLEAAFVDIGYPEVW